MGRQTSEGLLVRVAVVIPSYNGRELLARNLPGIVQAARLVNAPVTVADDASDDATLSWLASAYPSINRVPSAVRLGFARNCNRVFPCIQADVVVLLNSDVEVDPGFIPPLLRHFESRGDVFAVAPSVLSEGQGHLDEAVNFFTFSRGLLDAAFPCLAGTPPPAHAVPIGFAVGAAAALHRGKLMQLAGFDPIFSPFYCEDADLGYRAWRRGWPSLYEPRATVHHQYQGTIGSVATRERVRATHVRNKLFMTWRNLRDGRLWVRHLLWLGRMPFSHLRHRRWPELKGTLAALGRAGQVLLSRQRACRGDLPDREVLSRSRPPEYGHWS